MFYSNAGLRREIAELRGRLEKLEYGSVPLDDFRKVQHACRLPSDHPENKFINARFGFAAIPSVKMIDVADVVQQILDHLGLQISYTPETKEPAAVTLKKAPKRK
jgi:hypothetical protein